MAAVRLHREIASELTLGLAGIASIVFGLILFVAPGAGALALVWLIGAYAIVFGGLLLLLAIRIRRRLHGHPAAAGTPT